MSGAAPHYRHTIVEYVAIEEESSVRHEFANGEILAMAGGTPEHAALAAAVVTLLGGQLRGKSCRVYSSDLRLRVLETGLATYADASVVCGDISRDPNSPTHVTNPAVVVEVLSPSTEHYDRGEKREHYQRIPSLLVESDVATLSPIGCSLSVKELYDLAGIAQRPD
jgi:Uma2 family endonuclease